MSARNPKNLVDADISPLVRMPLAAALVVLLPIAFAWPVRALILASDPLLYQSQPLLPYAIISVFNVLTMAAGWWYLRARGLALSALGFRKPRPAEWALGAGAGLALIMAVYPIARSLVDALGLDPPRAFSLPMNDWRQIWGAVLLLGLIIPFTEEVLFRGFLISFLRSRLHSPLLAGLIGALLFAAVHLPRMGLGGALFILLWSSVPVALFLWTRNIFVTTAAHAINNLFAYVAVPLLLLTDP